MIRRWVRYAGIAGGIVALVPLHYLWRLVGARSPWPPLFLGWCGWVAGLRITKVGSPRPGATLIAANHASWLDILAIGGATGAAFVAKAELASVGFVRWLADMNETLYVQREDRGALHVQAQAIRTMLARGRPVAFFPEATTKGGHTVLPFRASLFQALYPPATGMVVQPVALDYGPDGEAVAWGQESGGANTRRIFARPGTIPLTMIFLDPLTPSAEMDRKRIAALSRDAVVGALGASEAAPARL